MKCSGRQFSYHASATPILCVYSMQMSSKRRRAPAGTSRWKISPAEAVQVVQRLAEARRKDPQVQLFPEITASIVGQDFMREGDVKLCHRRCQYRGCPK